MLDPTRLSLVQSLSLGSGSHARAETPTDGQLCVMEAVAYVAGEPVSDSPACACPVIATFLRNWNDGLPDADRTRLLGPLIPRLVGTKSTPAVEERRSYVALDWLIRTYTPAMLDLVPALAEHASALRAMPEIVDLTTAQAVSDTVRAAGAAAGAAAGDAAWAARDAARAAARAAAWAAWDAARDAARAAAWAARDAAGAAAGAAAGDAAWAAWDAARAAWDAARDAARDAAWAKLAPVVASLQTSALDLVDRMLAVKES